MNRIWIALIAVMSQAALSVTIVARLSPPVTVFCSCFNHTSNVSGAIFWASQLSHGFTIGEGNNGRRAHT